MGRILMTHGISTPGLVVRSLIALSLAVSLLGAAAPVAADTGETSASVGDVDEDAADPAAEAACSAYGEANPTAGSEARCLETYFILKSAAS